MFESHTNKRNLTAILIVDTENLQSFSSFCISVKHSVFRIDSLPEVGARFSVIRCVRFNQSN